MALARIPNESPEDYKVRLREYQRAGYRRRCEQHGPPIDRRGSLQRAHDHWWSKYRATPVQIMALWESQARRCGSCGVEVVAPGAVVGNRSTHIDHCHTTGKVRGILCSNCNTAIGLARENTNNLRGMIAYLEKHNGNAS